MGAVDRLGDFCGSGERALRQGLAGRNGLSSGDRPGLVFGVLGSGFVASDDGLVASLVEARDFLLEVDDSCNRSDFVAGGLCIFYGFDG